MVMNAHTPLPFESARDSALSREEISALDEIVYNWIGRNADLLADGSAGDVVNLYQEILRFERKRLGHLD